MRPDRERLLADIDAAVEGQITSELLGRVVKHSLGLRYLDSGTERLTNLVHGAVDAKVRELIAFYLKEWDDTLWDGVKARLADVHLDDLATAITDAFMDGVQKGTKP